MYPTELLNTLQPAGMTRHILYLKVGTPVILIRNLDRTKGLMNGTRLVVMACYRHYLQARVVNGSRAGTVVLIPRINLTPPDNKSTSICFVRRQFPIRLAFCMTINKAQGQTFKRVGLFLPEHVFAHGQCYVALPAVETQMVCESCCKARLRGTLMSTKRWSTWSGRRSLSKALYTT